MCRGGLSIDNKADGFSQPFEIQWFIGSRPDALGHAHAITITPRKMASLVLSKRATRIDLPQGERRNVELRSLSEALSIIHFVRLWKEDLQPPVPEAFRAPFPPHVLPQGETT